MSILGKYKELAGKSKSSEEFANAVVIWWKSKYTIAPPPRNQLHNWYNSRGY